MKKAKQYDRRWNFSEKLEGRIRYVAQLLSFNFFQSFLIGFQNEFFFSHILQDVVPSCDFTSKMIIGKKFNLKKRNLFRSFVRKRHFISSKKRKKREKVLDLYLDLSAEAALFSWSAVFRQTFFSQLSLFNFFKENIFKLKISDC